MHQVYGLINGDTMELRYIGQTNHPELRLRQHKIANHANLHLDRWLKKTHWSMIILERDPSDINEAEIRWIKEMREQGARLLNLADGGRGHPLRHSAETRAKISKTLTGHLKSAETCSRLSAALVGNKNALGHIHSAMTRAKISAAHAGRRHTPESRTHMRAAHLGHTLSAETRAKISASLKRVMGGW